MRRHLLDTFVITATFGILSCSGNGAEAPSLGEIGGTNSAHSATSSSSHNHANTGGAAGIGGGAASGGAVASGGAAAGGAASGGVASGGTKAATGGAASGGTKAATGGAASGGTKASGGTANGGTKTGTGGVATGGTKAMGGTKATTGGAATGGTQATTGGAATGGAMTGGSKATGGAATGGAMTGGSKATGGTSTAIAGSSATGGGTSVSTTSTNPTPDPDCNTPMPTGGTVHTYGSGPQTGGSGNLAWEIWSNGGSPGTLTTFTTPAFSATWNNSQNYLGRLGYEWGNSGAKYTAHGNITAQFVSKKSGSSNNSWSYVGMYGWTRNPCVEWYIVDDSFSNMPINPGNCQNMSNSPLSIDGGKYTMCVRNTSGTGGDRCGGAGNWIQYYSIRQNNRSCGTISVSKHFDAWAAAGNSMDGNLLEVKILVEVGGGQGTVDFPIANVQVTQ